MQAQTDILCYWNLKKAQACRRWSIIEGLTGNKYLERDADIARYSETIDYLRNLSLSPRESMRRMAEIRDDLRERIIVRP